MDRNIKSVKIQTWYWNDAIDDGWFCTEDEDTRAMLSYEDHDVYMALWKEAIVSFINIDFTMRYILDP